MEEEEREVEVRPFCRGGERVRIVFLVVSWRLLRVILKNRFIFVLRFKRYGVTVVPFGRTAIYQNTRI